MSREKLIQVYEELIKSNPNLWEDKYQREILTDPDFYTKGKKVIAGSVGFGKTNVEVMASIIESIIKGKTKTLIIPYATRVLRSNFYERYESLFPGMACVLETKEALLEWENNECPVGIALPVFLENNLSDSFKVDNLVVDEAQAWYFAEQSKKRGEKGTITKIIEKTNPPRQVLLTGSPYKFNAKKDEFKIYHVSTEQMRAEGRVADLKIEVAQTSINIKPNDYTKRFGSVKEEKFQDVVVNRKVVRELCKEIIKKVKLPEYSKEWYQINRLTDRAMYVLGKMGKTIIFCAGVDQANDWYEIIKSSGQVNRDRILLSHSKNDKDSDNFERFKNGEADILIAVDRGQLGYNDEELVNVIDATFTWNPMLVQQMMGRTMRPNDEISKKYFIKVAAGGMGYHVTNFMTCVLSLCRTDIYTTFTGKMGKLPVLIPNDEVEDKPKKRKKRSQEIKERTEKLDFYREFDVVLDIDLWTNFNSKGNDVLADYTAIELDDFLASTLGMKRSNGYWQEKGKEFCHKEALKYKTHTDFYVKSGGCASACKNMGWYEEVTSHMKSKRPRGWYKDKEENRKVALQYATRSLWASGKNGAQTGYEYARKQYNEDGTTWVEEFFPETEKTGLSKGQRRGGGWTKPTKPKKIKTEKEKFKNRSRAQKVGGLKRRKSINQYDKQGNLIKQWSSVQEIVEKTGYNQWGIKAVCIGKQASSKGFIWKYANDNDNFTLNTK